MDNKLFKHCWQCDNYKSCSENNWCILFDIQKKFKGDIVCDNFKLTNNEVYQISMQGSGQHLIVEDLREVIDFIKNTDEAYDNPKCFNEKEMIRELDKNKMYDFYDYIIEIVNGFCGGLPEFEGF